MARCGFCRAIVLGDEIEAGGNVYCGTRCYRKGHLAELARRLPPEAIECRTREIYESKCPDCCGDGPVDFHNAPTIWSAVFVTRTTDETRLSCRPCARKRQLDALWISACFGWWGVPIGLFMTSFVVVKLIRLLRKPDGTGPSRMLRDWVVQQLATELRRGKSLTGGLDADSQ